VIKYVYVASAITPYKTEHPVVGHWANIRRGIRAAVELYLEGYIPFCPHLDDFYFMFLRNGENITYNMIKKYSMAWLDKCDALLVLPRWRKSVGVKEEVEKAKKLGMPIFYSIDDLFEYEGKEDE